MLLTGTVGWIVIGVIGVIVVLVIGKKIKEKYY